MKLTVFQSDKGDCLLLTSKDDRRHVLIDGGMRASYKRFVAPALGRLATAGHKLDLVYVSHIDRDHISGVLQLMDDVVAWRVHDFRAENGLKPNRKPAVPRPPEIKEVWHNAFHDMVPDNNQPIGDLLAASEAELTAATSADLLSAAASVLIAAQENALVPADPADDGNGLKPRTLRELAEEYLELATSIPEALQLSRRLGEEQLGIPLNARFGRKLAFVREEEEPPDIRISPLRIFVIGPFEQDLEDLRTEWNEWLEANQEALERIREKSRQDAARMGVNDIPNIPDLAAAQAAVLGNRNEVTVPNLASLMLLVTEGSKTLLLCGDGHADDLLKGLRFHGRLADDRPLHVDILKVQHHGSEHNINEDFVRQVSADHYVFCGNGEHENPDLSVVRLILDSRLADVPFHAEHEGARGPFKLWFNSSPSATKQAKAKDHMRKLQELVEDRAAQSNGRLTARFLEGDTPSFELTV